jgi:hypothetical protein
LTQQITEYAYHPGREVVGACVNCGKMICAECKVTLSDKIYCQPCANKTFVAKKPSGAPVLFVIGSVVSSAIALFFVPPLFGIIGIVLGYLAYKRSRTAGIVTIAVALACLIIGMVLGFVYWTFKW